MRAWIKSKTADRVLSPVREQICKQIEQGSSIIDVGCGTGDLLFRCKDYVRFGTGVDIDPSMVAFASRRVVKEGVKNLRFVEKSITSFQGSELEQFDVSTSTLCLHTMPESKALKTLSVLASHTSKIIIADYSTTMPALDRFLTECDEIISGHYLPFKRYMRRGGVEYLAAKANLKIEKTMDTPMDGIGLWMLR